MLVADPPRLLENFASGRAYNAASVPLKRTPRQRRWPFGGPSLIPALALAMFLALPLVGLVIRAFGSGGLVDALARPIVVEALRLSAVTTVAVLGLSLVLGSPLALLLARRRFRGI